MNFLGDSNVMRVHFKDLDVYNISQPDAAAAKIGSREICFQKRKQKHQQKSELCSYPFRYSGYLETQI